MTCFNCFRSRGHGFIRPDPEEVAKGEIKPQDIFMHISDIGKFFNVIVLRLFNKGLKV